MSKTITIDLEGFKELEELFLFVPDDIAKRVGMNVLKKAAKPVLDQAKANVPVKSGGLRDSLAIAGVKRLKKPVVKVIARRGKGFQGHHAFLVELGTKPGIREVREDGNFVFKGKLIKEIDHPGTQKQPFLRPALLDKTNEALKIILEGITSELQKQLKRAMKRKK